MEVDKKMQAIFKGSYAELLFAAETVKRNWGLSTPFSDILPYDFIIDTRAKLQRIQVKLGQLEVSREGSYRANPSSKDLANGGNRLYSPMDVDYFAIYLSEIQTWYIIPVHVVTATTIRMYPDKETCKYRMYKNAWHLLG